MRLRLVVLIASATSLVSAGAAGSEVANILRQGLEIVSPTAREKLTPTVARWIASFRDGAVERGVEPVPPDVREAMSGFIPADVLDDVRWRVEGESGVLGRGLFQLGSAHAITLDNVILFGSAEEASDVGLWAHELYHVMQYRQWGLDGFVTRYLADHSTVEHEAKEFRYRWWKETRWQGD